MKFTNERDRELFEKIQSHLINTKDELNSIAMFCPFCQIGGTRKKSKKWSPSQRKGYILSNQSKGYDFAVFYCHNRECESRVLSRGSGGLSLEVFANYILCSCHFTDAAPDEIWRCEQDWMQGSDPSTVKSQSTVWSGCSTRS